MNWNSLFSQTQRFLTSISLGCTLLIPMTQQAEDIAWIHHFGGTKDDKIREIFVSPDGSCFATGEAAGQFTWENGSGPAHSKNLDVYLTKLDAQGKPLWTTIFGGEGVDRAYAVAPTGDGGCFITGHYINSALEFPDKTKSEIRGGSDIYIARFDGTGAFLWGKTYGGSGNDYGHAIAADGKGGCYVAGAYVGQVDFEGTSLGVNSQSKGSFCLHCQEGGTLSWVKGIDTLEHQSAAHGIQGIAVDAKGDIFLSGLQQGGADFGNGIKLDATDSQDAYIAKYSAEGSPIWATGTVGSSAGAIPSVVSDGQGGCFAVGIYQDKLHIGDQIYQSQGHYDTFVTRLDASGNILWLHPGGSTKTDYGLGITSNGSGGCLITGEYSDQATFRGTKKEKTLASRGHTDIFLFSYDAAGHLLSTMTMGDVNHDMSYSIAVSPDGGIYLGGAFRNQTDFLGTKLQSKGSNDLFVLKLKK